MEQHSKFEPRKSSAYRKEKKSSDQKKKIQTTSPFGDNDEEGTEEIIISKLTQKIIGCQIGVDITTEKPWIFVKRSRVIDNID